MGKTAGARQKTGARRRMNKTAGARPRQKTGARRRIGRRIQGMSNIFVTADPLTIKGFNSAWGDILVNILSW